MTQQSIIGRSKFGGSSTALGLVSLAGGVAIAGALAGLFYAVVDQNPLVFAIFIPVALPVAAALVWALMVDRTTIRGATLNPEASVESSWYDQATSDTYHATLFAAGIVALVSVFAPVEVPLSIAAAVLVVFLMGVFCISYQIRKRHG